MDLLPTIFTNWLLGTVVYHTLNRHKTEIPNTIIIAGNHKQRVYNTWLRNEKQKIIPYTLPMSKVLGIALHFP